MPQVTGRQSDISITGMRGGLVTETSSGNAARRGSYTKYREIYYLMRSAYNTTNIPYENLTSSLAVSTLFPRQ